MKWQTVGQEVPRRGNRFTQWCGRTLFGIMRWDMIGEFPNRRQFIVALAPHTSNIDFVLAACVIWGYRLHASFLIKKSVFFFPLSVIMNMFGAIPVDRSAASGLVEEMAQKFADNPRMLLGITPEGTRRKVHNWRKGFAHIAAAANVPVLPVTINYQLKQVRIEPLIEDVSDPDKTLEIVQQAAHKWGHPRR